MPEDRVEHLITRRLDGVSSDAESLELDKAVMRDPSARTALEQNTRIEAAARDALHRAFADPPPQTASPHRSPAEPIVHLSRARAGRRIRRLWTGAIAAAAVIALTLWLGHPAITSPDASPTPAIAQHDPSPSIPVVQMPNVHQPQFDAAATGTAAPREVLAIWDAETESFYMLEISGATAGRTISRSSIGLPVLPVSY